MPTYTFRNKLTQEEFQEFMSISAREKYLEENPDMEQVPTSATPTLDPVRMGRKKPDDGFRDVLRSIKKQNRGSNINTF